MGVKYSAQESQELIQAMTKTSESQIKSQTAYLVDVTT